MTSRSARLAMGRRVGLTQVALLLALLVGLVSAAAAEPSQVYVIVLGEQPVHELSRPVGDPYRAQVTELQQEARAVMARGGTTGRQELANLNAAAEATLNSMRRAILTAAGPALVESQAPVVDAVRSAGGEVIYQYRVVNALAARLPAGAAARLAARPDVAAVYADEPMSAQLNFSTYAIGASAWWGAGLDGGAWDVGVVDSGIDKYHPAFAAFLPDPQDPYDRGNLVEGRFLEAAEASGWDPSNDPSEDDVNGHGTRVASIISSGVVPTRGVAFGHDKLFNLKAGYDSDGIDGGPAYMTQSDAMAAVDWAYAQTSNPEVGDSPDVLNLSYGWRDYGDDYAFNRFWDAVVDDLEISVAIAAGNWGDAAIGYPSTAYNVISVANVFDWNTPSRIDDEIWTSSSRGPSLDGRLKPDLAAPGSYITSADNSWDQGGSTWTGGLPATGTSFASPHVAGALLLALDGGLYSPRAQKALLINTAEDRYYPDWEPGWDPGWGWGYLDLTHAYDHLNDVVEDRVYPYPDFDLWVGSLSIGETATLVWNRHVDYAGAAYPPLESAHDLNNLNLYLYDVYNNRYVDGSESTVDNVEQVRADADMTGVLRVQTVSADLGGAYFEPYALATEAEFDRMTGPELETSGGRSFHLEPGESVTFTLTITNAGDLTLHAVLVTPTIPSGVSLLEGVNPVAMGNLFPDGSQSATWVFQKDTDQVLRTITINTAGQGYGSSFGKVDLVRLIKPPDFFLPLVMRS